MAALRMFALTLTLWACATAAASAEPVGDTTLAVGRTGVQVGTVTDNLGQIDCGLSCTGIYQRDCQAGTPANCTEPGNAQQVTLTTTVPDGFGVIWNRACAEGSSTSSRCTLRADGGITAHYDDLTAPAFALTGPSAGPRRGTVALSATAADAQSGIADVEFFVGGVSAGTDAGAPFQIDFDTSSRPDGPVTVLARATNGDGDQSSDSVVITIDNTAPSLTVDGPDARPSARVRRSDGRSPRPM